jgi:hypothetical protein
MSLFFGLPSSFPDFLDDRSLVRVLRDPDRRRHFVGRGRWALLRFRQSPQGVGPGVPFRRPRTSRLLVPTLLALHKLFPKILHIGRSVLVSRSRCLVVSWYFDLLPSDTKLQFLQLRTSVVSTSNAGCLRKYPLDRQCQDLGSCISDFLCLNFSGQRKSAPQPSHCIFESKYASQVPLQIF